MYTLAHLPPIVGADARTSDSNADIAHAGDTVIVHCAGELTSLRLQVGGSFETRFGRFSHDDVLGRPLGGRVYARDGGAARRMRGGFVEVLRWTPELWTRALRHRTQILYFADCAAIVAQLGLRPGAVVIESGTGSGSLTSALARAVAPHGHVHTFDFNAGRAEAAAIDVAALGLSGVVTPRQGDACAGFGRDLDGTADAVFLDLPSPWAALPHAHAALKATNGAVCCFSPCIEQVQRTCLRLRGLGFEDIRTVEALARDYEVLALEMPRHPCARPFFEAGVAVPEPAVLAPAYPSTLLNVTSQPSRPNWKTAGKRPRQDAAAQPTAAPGSTAGMESSSEQPGAPPRAPAAAAAAIAGLAPTPPYPAWAAAPQPLSVRQVGEGASGHTGYLTFAMLYSKRLSSADALAGRLLTEDDAQCLISRDSTGGDEDSSEEDGDSQTGSSGAPPAA